MKIKYDFRIFNFQKYGGISRYFVLLILNLKSNKVGSFSILCLFHLNAYLDKNNNLKDGFFYLAKLTTHNSLYLKIVKVINLIWEQISLLISPPDIYHITYYDSLPITWSKTKLVITVYDMIHELYPHQFSMRAIAIKKKCIEKADLLICISENTKKDLVRILNINDQKVKVIYLGFEDFMEASKVKISFEFDKYILFVGQRGGYKNFNNLLIAYSNLKDINLNYKLVCFGGGSFSVEENAKINVLNLQNRIIYLEGGDDLLQYLYSSASLFVYPSLYEGFGIPPLEAMACGTPVCCSNTSSLPEVVGPAAELFNPNSVEEISSAISKVLHSECLRNELIFKGKERVKYFTWEKCAIETYIAYKSIL